MTRPRPLGIAHLSDPHIRPAGRVAVGGVVDSRAVLVRALEVLTTWDVGCAAWVFTGDLTDEGDAESYAWLRATVTDAARAAHVRVVWANGNHDDRVLFRTALVDADAVDAPYNAEHRLDGLRVLVLDTSVPGVPWGRVDPGSLAWLADRLADPAPDGTLLVMHHAPLPVVQDAAALWSLREPDAVARLVRGSDVRGILSGHFHQSGWGTFAGVPVALATSLAYTQDLTRGRTLRGHDAGQGFNLVQMHPDTVLHTVVPLVAGVGVHDEISPERARALAGPPPPGDGPAASEATGDGP